MNIFNNRRNLCPPPFFLRVCVNIIAMIRGSVSITHLIEVRKRWIDPISAEACNNPDCSDGLIDINEAYNKRFHELELENNIRVGAIILNKVIF